MKKTRPPKESRAGIAPLQVPTCLPLRRKRGFGFNGNFTETLQIFYSFFTLSLHFFDCLTTFKRPSGAISLQFLYKKTAALKWRNCQIHPRGATRLLPCARTCFAQREKEGVAMKAPSQPPRKRGAVRRQVGTPAVKEHGRQAAMPPETHWGTAPARGRECDQ